MKIEKLNDNQIRCTLTSQDLISRKIKLSELAYGTEKARMLFHDMMSEANQMFGFNIDNSPLMVEAIPVAPDSIVLIITKVDDPQELDTRFSKFAPLEEEAPQPAKAETPHYTAADEILELLQKFHKKASEAGKEKSDTSAPASDSEAPVSESKESAEEVESTQPIQDLIRAYCFSDLDAVIQCARVIGKCYSFLNTLYKTEPGSVYILVLHQTGMEPKDFNKLCNMLSEYSMPESLSRGGEAYFLEHGQIICRDNALQNLATL